MRLFKFITILAVITSMGLVGCNKDTEEAIPKLEMKTFIGEEYESYDCADINDEEVQILDCNNDCVKLTLNADNTAVYEVYEDGEIFLELEGVYTIEGIVFTLDLTSSGVVDLLVGEITADNNFYIESYDEDFGCTEKTTFTE